MRSAGSYSYVLSLPERVVRSLGALSGGLLREIGTVMLPASLRRTALYRNMIDVTIRFLVEEVGQVESVNGSEDRLAQNFLLRRTASHGIELLGILTFRASPVWVLAVLADVTGAGHRLIREITDSFKEEGLLDPESRFETMDELLDGLEKSSAHLADTLNMPPIDIAGLRRELKTLQEQLPRIPIAKMPTPERLERVWMKLQQSAESQGRSVFVISSLMAISTLAQVPANMLWLSRASRSAARRTGRVFADEVLQHYSTALDEISDTGVMEYWRRQFRPYLRAAAVQFVPQRKSSTERLLRKIR